jgi:DNA-directed RNA polymerase subunit RPC12/RpoP
MRCRRCKGELRRVRTRIGEHGRAVQYRCPKCGSERIIRLDFLKDIFSIPVKEVKTNENF